MKVPFTAEFCAPKRYMTIVFYDTYLDYNKASDNPPEIWYIGRVIESECPPRTAYVDMYEIGSRVYYEMKDFESTPIRVWKLNEITEAELTAYLIGITFKEH